MVVSFFHLEISLCLVVTNSTKESYKNIEAAISTQIHVSSHIRLFTTCLYIYIDDCNWVAPHLSFSAARISAGGGGGALPLHLVLLSPLSLHLSFPLLFMCFSGCDEKGFVFPLSAVYPPPWCGLALSPLPAAANLVSKVSVVCLIRSRWRG